MASKVLLINPSYSPSYGGSKVGLVNPIAPTLGLATIAATALEKNLNPISPVLSSFGGNFSIIKINKFIPPSLQGYSKVYSRIEALLLKNKKEKNNSTLFNLLLNKYKIEKNISILP